jgi:hypothetical protein
VQKVWSKTTDRRTGLRTAENGLISHSFMGPGLTVRNGEDCYTFEGFAPSPDVIRTAYYYYYKRTILGLKEETTWS